MTMLEVSNYLDNKINENDEFIKITFYEIRVKYNLTSQETQTFLEIAKNKFENIGYSVYFTDDFYEYQNAKLKVEPNELMIAIKNIK